MDTLFQFTSNIFPSNPSVGTLGSIDLNLSYLQWFGIPLFGVKNTSRAYKTLIVIYGLLTVSLIRVPYYGFEMYDLVSYWRNLNDLTQNMCLSMMHLCGALKLIMIFSRLGDIQRINKQFEYLTKRYVKSPRQIDTFYWNEFENKLSFIMYSGIVGMAAILAMVLLFYDSSGIGTAFPYRARMPDITPFSFKLTYMTTSVLVIAVQIAGIDYLNVTFINLTRCQLQILNIAFDQLNEAVVGKVSVGSLKHLNDLVEHHNFILDIRQQIESVFKFPMLVQFFASLLIFAVTGFQALVQSDTSGLVMTYVYVACILAELFLYCWFGNEVSEQNKTLALRAYETSWYTFDTKFRKSLQIFLLNAQKPFYFTAGGYVILNLLTFSRILSKSYTYIAVLRQQYAGK